MTEAPETRGLPCFPYGCTASHPSLIRSRSFVVYVFAMHLQQTIDSYSRLCCRVRFLMPPSNVP